MSAERQTRQSFCRPNPTPIKKKETDNQGLMRIERMNQTGTKKEAYTSSTIKYQLKNSLNTLVAPTGIEPVYHA